MSIFSNLGAKCLLPAAALLTFCLLLQPAARGDQNAAEAETYNPLRSGEKPWTRDQGTIEAAPEKSQPSPVSAAPRLHLPRVWASQPQPAALPEGTDSIAARPIPMATRPPTTLALAPTETEPAASEGTVQRLPTPVRLMSLQQTDRGTMEPAPTPAEPMTEAAPQGSLAPIEPIPAPNDAAPLTNVQPQMWQSCQPNGRCGVACPSDGCPRPECRWKGTRVIPWQVFAQGEYVGPARLAHVPQYHLRVDDIIRMVYGLTGEPSSTPYALAVGDIVQIESNGDPKISRQVTIQPDGMVTLRYLGQVRAAGLNLEALRKDLDSRYSKYVREPAVSVTPIKLNSRVEELRSAVDQRYGPGGQGVFVRVTPAGTVQLPSIGSIPVQGLTLDEVKREIEARYARRFHGIEVTPVLDHRAPRYLFVLGEVRNPGRFELEGPTTAMQAIAMAGGWNVGAELRQAVVFRRDDCWRLMATRLHLRSAVRGTHPCPPDEIWLRDSDVLLIPKSRLLETDDAISLLFTRGLYGVVPFNVGLSWSSLSAL